MSRAGVARHALETEGDHFLAELLRPLSVWVKWERSQGGHCAGKPVRILTSSKTVTRPSQQEYPACILFFGGDPVLPHTLAYVVLQQGERVWSYQGFLRQSSCTELEGTSGSL